MSAVSTVVRPIAEAVAAIAPDVHVDPVEYLVVDDERVVVIGRYWGSARDGVTSVDAAFAHVITTRAERMAALHQITDTARWCIPCR